MARMNPHIANIPIAEKGETMGSAAAAHVESIFTRHLSVECDPTGKDNPEILSTQQRKEHLQ